MFFIQETSWCDQSNISPIDKGLFSNDYFLIIKQHLLCFKKLLPKLQENMSRNNYVINYII